MTKKEHVKQIGLAVPALLLAFTTLAAVPAFASRGSDSIVSADTTTSVSSDNGRVSASTSTGGSGAQTTEVSTALAVASNDTQTTELHSKGKALVAELQKEHKPKQTDSERQKVCEAHKQGLTNKFTVITRNSQSYQTRIDDVYAKVLGYQTTKNITSSDLTNLIATADAAKATSATSIANLLTVAPSLDCNNVSVAQDVATFKAAATQTRTDLMTYKAAVKAVIQALKAATTVTSTTTAKTTETSN